MIEITSIELGSNRGGNKQREPVVTGIPFAIGKLLDVGTLRLAYATGEEIPAYCHATAKWPDGSIKWLLLYFQAETKLADREKLYLYADNSGNAHSRNSCGYLNVLKDQSGESVTIDTGKAIFRIRTDESGPLEQVVVNGNEQLSGNLTQLIMEDASGAALSARVTSISYGDESNLLQRTLTLNGNFPNLHDDPLAEFVIRMTFFSGLECVKIECSVQNPRAAEHPKGKWDLGDNGSIFFNALVFEFSLLEDSDKLSAFIKPEPNHDWLEIQEDNCSLYQDSSGGDNWHSNNHMNTDNDIPTRFQGYCWVENTSEKYGGLRADPLLRLRSKKVGFSAYISDFWQNFPKAIQIERNVARIHLFPASFSDTFELQGGEQKTHTFFLDFSGEVEALNWSQSPRRIKLDSTYLARTGVMSFLPEKYIEDDMQKLINAGLDGKHNFFAKRELIDEFGWRNFGDIYADHEELNYSGKTPLVSHYNNQYDALEGFLRQYLVSGDSRWFDLAAPLARHIVDIDIYNTVEDRDEYNGGLFWHTDHYLNALTSTHRTFSNGNSLSYDGDPGGGPGSEHCYTAGLTSFFFLTGDKRYKEAALKLVCWIECSMEKSNILLERVWQFFRKDLAIIHKLMRRQIVPNVSYPLSRATGNYLSSILDAFHLTSDVHYLRRAESIIKGTVHPNDDISLRGLDDIEAAWSYLIFLQAITRYMFFKTVNGEIDESFLYAKDCFLHYANWILAHERPFLESRDQLDFPNLTWVAQDLRKAYVLQIASCLQSQNKKKFQLEATTYRDYVTENLNDEKYGQVARILVILMQNALPESAAIETVLGDARGQAELPDYGEAPRHSLGKFVLGIFGDLSKRMLRLSLRKEIRWLKFRMKS